MATHRQTGEVAEAVPRAALTQGLDRRAQHVAVTAAVEFPFLAAADQQHPVAERVGQAVQQQGLVCPAVEVAAPQNRRDDTAARLVQRLGRLRQPAVLEDADDDAGDALLFRIPTLGRVFHKDSPRVDWCPTSPTGGCGRKADAQPNPASRCADDAFYEKARFY